MLDSVTSLISIIANTSVRMDVLVFVTSIINHFLQRNTFQLVFIGDSLHSKMSAVYLYENMAWEPSNDRRPFIGYNFPGIPSFKHPLSGSDNAFDMHAISGNTGM